MKNIFLIYQQLLVAGEGNATLSLYVWHVLLCLLLVGVGAGLMYVYMRRRMNKKLDQQKAYLDNVWFKKMSEKESSFFVRMSEELRGPISQIVSPLQTLFRADMPADIRPRVLAIMQDAQTLLHRVNMMLDVRNAGSDGHLLPETRIMKISEMETAVQVTYEPLSSLRKQVATAVQEAEEKPLIQEKPVTEEKPLDVAKTRVDDSNVADWTQNQANNEEQPTDHPFTILMVDDNPHMRRFVRDYFRGEYNVITASDGEEAMQCLMKSGDIDLVVTDLTMPKMNGFELCRHIKTDLRWSHIPVIMLTGRTGEELEVEGLKVGADDYVTKPFNPEMLRLRVKNLIETKEDRQKKFWAELDLTPGDLTITSVDAEFLQKVIKVCESRISDTEFSVEALGHEMNMSRTYLYKKMMNITGKGPGEFIRTIRLRRGKRLLEHQHLQIADVAAALGYSSPKRFSENFKAEFGILPSEYLRKIRMEETMKKE